MKIIINTVIVTLPSLANVGGLLILILYMFSILGVQLFAGMPRRTAINDHANFDHFGIAFLTLVRISTG